MSWTTHHMCTNISGALANWKDSLWHNVCTADDGRMMSAREVKDFFKLELAKGHEVYPFGDCDNFDWIRGCLGHKSEEINVALPTG